MFIFFNEGTNGVQQDIVQVTLRTKESANGAYTHQFEYEGEQNPPGCTGSARLHIEDSGSDVIEGSFCFDLELFAGGGDDEIVTVSGHFTAISPF